MRNIHLLLLIVIAALSSISCSQSFDGTGELSLRILRDDRTAKSLTTDHVYNAAMDIASYEYKAVCKSSPEAHGTRDSWTILSVSNNSSTLTGLSRGNWTISIRAKNSNGGVILQGEASFFLNSTFHSQSITLTTHVTDYSVPIPDAVTVSIGVTVPLIENSGVIIRYTPLSSVENLNNSGTGGYPIDVSSAENHRTVISGSTISLLAPSPGDTAYYGSVSLSPGLYVFQVLFKHEGSVVSGQTIAVYVGELSPFAINGTLTAGEYISFTVAPSVTFTTNTLYPYFSQTPNTTANGHITASVSFSEPLTDPVYEWYVNGIPDAEQGGASYTSTGIYYSGKYTLSCVVSGTVDERRAMGYVSDDIEIVPLSSVGGTVFYIDSSATGTYEFYNSLGARVSEPSIGTDCTDLRYRQVSPGNGKDKFYVYNEDAIVKSGSSGSYNSSYVAWTYLDENNASYYNYYSHAGYMGRVYDSNVDTAVAIGAGKVNTQNIMSILRNVRLNGVLTYTNAYIQGRCKSLRGQSTFSETIWYVCDQFNKGTYWRFDNNTGCNDWFIPSLEEVRQFSNHFASISEFMEKTSKNSIYTVLWTSSAYTSSDLAYCWVASSWYQYNYHTAEYRDYGISRMALVLVRAF